jgi:hypothetical protein
MSKPKQEAALLDVVSTPPFCPNPKCRWHTPEIAKAECSFRKYGARPVTRYPYVTKLYQCCRCRKVFSDSIFHLFYRDRTEPTYAKILHAHRTNKTKLATAEDLGCSPDTINRRFKKLAAQGLLIQAKKSESLRISESVAYDGIENFAFSQFDPNNINHVIGRDSFFLYDFNYSPLNRKGRMSPAQAAKKKFLENKFAPYPTDAIRTATQRILQRLLQRTDGNLLFHSDKHFMYREAIASLEEKDRVKHFVTPAKVARNFRNRLFAINHCDLLTRQRLATFKRETVSFAKHSIAMVESFAIHMISKNFLRPIFLKKHKKDPKTNTESPAMRVGLETKILTFEEFYRICYRKTQVALSDDWLNFVNRHDPTSRRPIAA